MSDKTYVVQVTFSITVAAEDYSDAEAGARDYIRDVLMRDGREPPDVEAEGVGEI